jgi:hypothetical protein
MAQKPVVLPAADPAVERKRRKRRQEKQLVLSASCTAIDKVLNNRGGEKQRAAERYALDSFAQDPSAKAAFFETLAIAHAHIKAQINATEEANQYALMPMMKHKLKEGTVRDMESLSKEGKQNRKKRKQMDKLSQLREQILQQQATAAEAAAVSAAMEHPTRRKKTGHKNEVETNASLERILLRIAKQGAAPATEGQDIDAPTIRALEHLDSILRSVSCPRLHRLAKAEGKAAACIQDGWRTCLERRFILEEERLRRIKEKRRVALEELEERRREKEEEEQWLRAEEEKRRRLYKQAAEVRGALLLSCAWRCALARRHLIRLHTTTKRERWQRATIVCQCAVRRNLAGVRLREKLELRAQAVAAAKAAAEEERTRGQELQEVKLQCRLAALTRGARARRSYHALMEQRNARGAAAAVVQGMVRRWYGRRMRRSETDIQLACRLWGMLGILMKQDAAGAKKDEHSDNDYHTSCLLVELAESCSALGHAGEATTHWKEALELREMATKPPSKPTPKAINKTTSPPARLAPWETDPRKVEPPREMEPQQAAVVAVTQGPPVGLLPSEMSRVQRSQMTSTVRIAHTEVGLSKALHCLGRFREARALLKKASVVAIYADAARIKEEKRLLEMMWAAWVEWRVRYKSMQEEAERRYRLTHRRTMQRIVCCWQDWAVEHRRDTACWCRLQRLIHARLMHPTWNLWRLQFLEEQRAEWVAELALVHAEQAAARQRRADRVLMRQILAGLAKLAASARECTNAAIRIQSRQRGVRGRRNAAVVRGEQQTKAATAIQAGWRGGNDRKSLDRLLAEEAAAAQARWILAITVQAWCRGGRAREEARKRRQRVMMGRRAMVDRAAKAAKADTRKWRQHISRMGGAKWQVHGEWDLLAGIAITELGQAEAALTEARRAKKAVSMEWGVEGVKRRQKAARANAKERAEQEIELMSRMQSSSVDGSDTNTSKEEVENRSQQWKDARERVRMKHADAAAVEVAALRQRAKSESLCARGAVEKAVARHRAAAAAAAAEIAAVGGKNPKGTKEERHAAAAEAAEWEVQELQAQARELRVRAETIATTILQRQQRRVMGAARAVQEHAAEEQRFGAATCIQRRARGAATRSEWRAQWVADMAKRSAVQEARPASAAGPTTPTARAIALATAAAKTALSKAKALMPGEQCPIEELFECLDNELPDLREASFAFACGSWDTGDGNQGYTRGRDGSKDRDGSDNGIAFRVRVQPNFRGGQGEGKQLCAFIQLRTAVELLHTDAISRGRLWAQAKRCLQQQSAAAHYNRVRRAIEQRGGGLCDKWQMGTFLFRRFVPPPSSGVYRIPLGACTASALSAATITTIPRGLKANRTSAVAPKIALAPLDLSHDVAENAPVSYQPLKLAGVRESGWRGAADQEETRQTEGDGKKWRSMLRWSKGKNDKTSKASAKTPRGRAKSVIENTSACQFNNSATGTQRESRSLVVGRGKHKVGCMNRPVSCPPCIRHGYELHGLVDRSIVEVALDKVAQRVETDGELERMTKLRSRFPLGTAAAKTHTMADGACGDTERQYVELPWCRCQGSCEPGMRKYVSCVCCECFRALCYTCHEAEHVGEHSGRAHTHSTIAPRRRR